MIAALRVRRFPESSNLYHAFRTGSHLMPETSFETLM
jgi:hypothetical protein